ncbi:MAG: hypothetical protein K8T20_13665 [Planctomycetes bacterium]|nr:hypothetical protein [Planctomycetota bacterium]
MGGKAGWGIAGLVAGALLSALLFKFVESRRVAPGGGETPGHGESVTAPVGGEATEVERLRGQVATSKKDSEALRAEIVELRGKLEAAGKANPGGGTPGAAKSWREIAAKLYKLRDLVKGKKWDDWPAEAKNLQLEMFQMVGELSRRLGMPFDEALMSPEGLPRLLVDMLEQTEPPPSPEEKARLEALLESVVPDWKAYDESRATLSKLEQRLAMADCGRKTLGAILDGLRPEQVELAKGYEVFEVHDEGGPSTWLEGTREKVTKDLTANWVSALKLDPLQQSSIAPVVDEYINKAQELNNALWKRKQAGEEIPRKDEYGAQVALMIETQKKLALAARLTEEQAKAMKDWGEVYGVNVYQPPPPPPPR